MTELHYAMRITKKLRQAGTWLFVWPLLATACGTSPRPSGQDPDAAVPAPDAGPVTCQAAPRPTPLPLPPRTHLAQAHAYHGGPVALPRPATRPLPAIAQRRPQRAHLRLAGTAERVAQRTLVLSAVEDEPSYGAARSALERLGAPFEVHIATTTPFSSMALFEDDGTCRYSSVILSTDMLAYYDAPYDQWVSALSVEEWDMLSSYEVVCGAREAVWYAYPNPDLGMTEVSSFASEDAETGTLTAEGQAMFPYLNPAAQIPVQDVWGYRGQITTPETTTPLVVTPTGEALVVKHRRTDGTEVVAITVDSGTFSLHSQLLEYGVIAWLQRGLFLGERRVYLTAQMDDVYLYTDLWKIGATSAEESDTSYRMTPTDVSDLAAWQSAVQARLPAGSTFVTHLPFNGIGTLASVYPDTGLTGALDAVSDEFVWVNHTWDHEDMDAMTRERARAEMAANCQLAEERGFEQFTCNAAVTPHVSGLDNPAAVEGMLAAGVDYVVSDTSVTAALRPGNPGSNPSHNVGRRNPIDPALFQIPRHPTNIFYSTSLDTEQVDLYNFLYRDWFGRDLSYQELLAEDTSVALSYLMTYDIDPLMFHQANLRFWAGADAQRHSLYSDWVDMLLDRYLALVNLPVLSLSLPEIAAAMQQREAYDGCGATAVVVSDESGRHLELTTTAGCVVPVTGLAAADAGTIQEYGGVTTTFVEAAACEPLVLPLH